MIYPRAQDNPPSYENATQDADGTSIPNSRPKGEPHIDKRRSDQSAVKPAPPHPTMHAGPSYAPQHATTVHHYVNSFTGEHVASILPPDHPEMICLQEGRHIRRTKFGLLGVLAAVFWFPLGVGLCLLDRRVKCDRCGRMLEDGILCG